MIRFLTLDDVVRIHEVEVGPDPILDFGLLESAVLRPQTTVGGQDAYMGIHSKAGALFHSLCRNHAFENGNKRTAVAAVLSFYGLNGWWLEAEQGELLALAVDTAEGLVDAETIGKRFAEWARDEVSEFEAEDDA